MRKKAFTLIELLVVIAIIALLLSILMPALGKIKKKTKALVCRTNLKQLAIALEAYTVDHEGKALISAGNSEYWFLQIAPYMSDSKYQYNPQQGLTGAMKVLFCPSTKEPVPVTDPYYPLGTVKNRWKYHVQNFQGEGSYALNEWVGGWIFDGPQGQIAYGSIKEEEVAFSFRNGNSVRADTPVFGDAIWMGALPRDTDEPPSELDRGRYWEDGMVRLCVDRHDMAINMSFSDGHTELVELGDLWMLKWNKAFKPTKIQVPPEW